MKVVWFLSTQSRDRRSAMLTRLSIGCVVLGLVGPCAAQIVQGPVFNPVTGSRYFVYQAPTWTAAQAFARSMGADLATVNDAAEDAWIVANLTGGNTRKLFIGLNDASVEGVFVWSDGSEAPYRNWRPNEPGALDRVIIQSTGGWDAVSENYTSFAVIEMTGPVRVPGEYPSIQAAINGVQAGTEIVVAPGTYLEHLNFGGQAVVLRSTAGAELTIVDGEGDGPVVAFHSGEPASTVLEGFTIRNGHNTVGGGISVTSGASPTIRNCVVRGCSATNGGAVYVAGARAHLENCRLTSNSAGNGAGIGVYFENGSAALINCLIDSNGGDFLGAIAAAQGARVEVRNCTIVNNMEPMVGAFLGASMSIHNSIVWAADPLMDDFGGVAAITYTNISGGYKGVGNISAEPRFLGAGDYRLALDSPCIDAGNLVQYAGYGGMSDLAGEGRAVDEPSVANTGIGRPPIDMGAYEFQALKGCPSDFNRDGVVNSQDFFDFLASFFGGC
jgi:hypothetical protein